MAIDGLKPHWATPEALAEPLPETDTRPLLSPFDPLVIQRKRLAAFFGYDHAFEAYVRRRDATLRLLRPAGPRRRPHRRRHRPKADRAGGRLLIQQWTWIDARATATAR